MKCLVTGGAGFIGSHIVRELVEKGHEVVVFDKLLRGKREYISDLIESGKVKFIEGDIRNVDEVKEACKGIDYIFHQAAVCINRSLSYPQEAVDINIKGTLNMLESAAENNVKKFIFASSASVYGNPQYVPMDEKHPFNPITPYCVSKIAGEQLCSMYAKNGLKYMCLRYFNVYGKKQAVDAFYTSVIVMWVKTLLEGGRPFITGDGSQSMDFVNVKDVAHANILAMESDRYNETYNVASGVETNLNELYSIVAENCGKADVKPEYKEDVKVGVKRRLADISKIKNELGYNVTVPLKQGLGEMIQDLRKDPSLYGVVSKRVYNENDIGKGE